MAYLTSTTLTCPTCQFSADIRIVVGIGPGSHRDDTPSQKYKSAAPFTKGAKGTLLCPKDGTVVWTNIPGKKADE